MKVEDLRNQYKAIFRDKYQTVREKQKENSLYFKVTCHDRCRHAETISLTIRLGFGFMKQDTICRLCKQKLKTQIFKIDEV